MNTELQRPKLKTLFKEKELWLLVLIGILYFYRPLFLGETFFIRDLTADIIPQKHTLVEFIRSGELPLWTPYPHGGQPYWADITYFPLYPSNLLYLILPFFTAFNLNIVLHIIGGLVIAYLFARVIGLQPVSSVIVSTVYVFCGYSLSQINLGGRFLAILYIPLLLLIWHLFLLKGARRWFVMTVLFGVALVLTGTPESTILCLLLLLGWSVVYPYQQRPVWRRLLLWICLGVFMMGIASVQLLPTFEMASQSYRKGGFTYQDFTRWSLYPSHLPDMVVPGFFGHVDMIPFRTYYWGSTLMEEKAPLMISLYFGGVALLLGCIGGLRRKNAHCFPFRVRLFLLIVFGSSLLLSFGRFAPGFDWLYKFVPLMSVFRYPVKFLMAGIFPFALLAGYASEIYFRPPPSEDQATSPSWGLLVGLWSIFAVVAIFTLIFHLSDGFSAYFIETYFKQPVRDIIREGLKSSFTHAAIIWLLITLLYTYRRYTQRNWQQWLLAGILLLDLLGASQRINTYAPRELFTTVPELADLVRREIGDGRLFQAHQFFEFTVNKGVFDDLFWYSRVRIELLQLNIPAFYGIPTIFHPPLALTQARLVGLFALIDSVSWEKRLPWLSAGGVTLMLTPERLTLPDMQQTADIPYLGKTHLYLYRNTKAAKRVEFVTNWRQAASDSEALDFMLRPGFDPRQQVILQIPEPPLFDWPFKILPTKQIEPDRSQCRDSAIIRKHSATFQQAALTVSNSCDGYLVFSEPFYPNWFVAVGGIITPVLRANYAFSAIYLPPGTHEIERFYRPNAVVLGILSSLVFCFVLGIISYTGWLFDAHEG